MIVIKKNKILFIQKRFPSPLEAFLSLKNVATLELKNTCTPTVVYVIIKKTIANTQGIIIFRFK